MSIRVPYGRVARAADSQVLRLGILRLHPVEFCSGLLFWFQVASNEGIVYHHAP